MQKAVGQDHAEGRSFLYFNEDDPDDPLNEQTVQVIEQAPVDPYDPNSLPRYKVRFEGGQELEVFGAMLLRSG